MKVNNALSFNGSVIESESFNSSFYKVKMKVFAFGDNRNGSNFSPESFSLQTQSSMSLIPIVAKYNADEDDLEGHNVNLKKNNKGEYEFHFDTYPFGVVSPESNITLEEVNEGSEELPNIKTYVVVDNIYLWKRYEATKKIISWLDEGVSPKVSMEIDNVSGQFSDNGYFQIESFEFQAITALGSDIEPCFPRAEIEVYEKQDFKSEFKALVYELNETLKIDEQGGTEMAEVVETQETPEVKFEAVTTEETKQVEEVVESEKVEDTFEANVETEVETVEEVEPEKKVETHQEFALTANQLQQQIRVELEKEHYHDSWGDKCRKYWFVDNTDSVVIFEDFSDGYQLHAAPYTITGDTVELKLDEVYKVKVEYVAFEGESTSFASNFERIEDEKVSIQSQLDELKTYKRSREEGDIESNFADKLTSEEISSVFTTMKDASIEDVEVKLFAMYGKKNFSVTKSAQVTQTNKISFSLPEDNDLVLSPYGDILDK